MGKVIHFEIPAKDTARAQTFYQEIFGWKANAMPEMKYIIFQTGPTDEKGMNLETGFINGGMMKRDGQIKNPVITIAVENIKDTFKEIVKHGGEMIKDKMEVGDMGYAAYFKDSEGNVLGLWENKR